MKKKNLAIVILCAIILLPAALLLIDLGSFNFSLNIKKYYSESTEDFTFDFYGSFGNIRKVKVSDGDGKLCTLKISADADAFDGENDAVVLCDINSDGYDDLLILEAVDTDKDIHRALFVRVGDSFRREKNVDAVNPEMHESILICEQKTFEYLAETVEEYTVPYKSEAIRTEYEYSDGEIIPARELRVTYYSESRIYCIGTWEYNSTYGELMSNDEDWLDEKEYSALRPELEKIFGVALPD